MNTKPFLWPTLVASLALAGACSKSRVEDTAPIIAADAIYTGGDILTMEGDTPQYTEAVAVLETIKGGKVYFTKQ